MQAATVWATPPIRSSPPASSSPAARVHHSVLSPNVRIHSWSQVVDSILFDGVVVNRRARVYKAILDKNVVLTENSTVGIDTEHDLARGFTVTPDGITVVPKNTIVDD